MKRMFDEDFVVQDERNDEIKKNKKKRKKPKKRKNVIHEIHTKNNDRPSKKWKKMQCFSSLTVKRRTSDQI